MATHSSHSRPSQHSQTFSAHFDTRGYPVVDVRTGYAGWVERYEETVEDLMDVDVLASLAVPRWHEAVRAADLGCGTGRTGAWLRGQGVGAVDGVDLTPQMLERARARGAHEKLIEADLAHTGLSGGAYPLVVTSLVDEHLPDLRPLYREAFRLAAPDGLFVLVGLHPQFIMTAGMPTHFTAADGTETAITTHLHYVGDHVAAGLAAGWTLAELREEKVGDAWVARKPKWERYRGVPVSAAYVWRKIS
ncbi:class I SAM-dependent DNA methyltransferase [Streptacidiphilus jiangxiensis]|uniref:Methyltransferase domain-containing protein n=1 Tax=Streptacidiphilus jiangxiensis TaxID=235985 RepID=A0A1H7LY54_STRJI|nr:class I SAM-dependent methyltransferase [Streptacidiphilus jiangxiensis]SEL03903.1 Methyltransferase domain-containing protein [Streptacidiphilus jiangxiensis]